MRVIAGTAKGRRLKTLKGVHQRPTTNRVKESIFAMLGEQIHEADVLDLFAGTGNLGIEALSRGARTVLFIDNSVQAREIIEENLHLTQFIDKAEIWLSDCYSALKQLQTKGRGFDLVFADPPYGRGFGRPTLLGLDKYGLLKSEGLFILEHPSDEDIHCPLRSMHKVVEKIFGQTQIQFYQCIQMKE